MKIKTFGDMKSKTKPVEEEPVGKTSSISDVFARKNAQKNAETIKPQVINPKPLFKPTVQTVVCTDIKNEISTVIADLKLNDFHITDVEISRINGLKDTIRLDDPNMISDWGSAASKSSEEIINQLSEIIKNSSIDNVRIHLNNIFDMIKSFDVKELKKEESFFSNFFAVKKKKDFKTVDVELLNEIVECNKQLAKIKSIHNVFSEMFDKNETQFRKLTIYIVSGFMFVKSKKDELATLDQSMLDFFAKQRIVDTHESMSRFERRLNTLTQLRYSVLLRIAQLRLEQKNIFMLIDNVSEVLTLLIPSWRQQMLTLTSTAKVNVSNDMYSSLESIQNMLIQKIENPSDVSSRPNPPQSTMRVN